MQVFGCIYIYIVNDLKFKKNSLIKCKDNKNKAYKEKF